MFPYLAINLREEWAMGGGTRQNNGERDQTVGSFGTSGADSRKTNP